MATTSSTPPRGAARARAERSGAAARPRLAYVYDEWFGTTWITHAAAGLCDLVWIIDGSDPGAQRAARLLRRLGSVLDVAGLSLDETAARIAASGASGILTQFDGALVWVAQLAERLGLPGVSPAVAERLADKYHQRLALRDAGLPVPAFHSLAGGAEDLSALEGELAFPAVLKPRHGWGSRHTTLVRSPQDLRRALAQAPGGGGEMILEGYLPDRPGAAGAEFASYVSVETLVSRSRPSHVAVSGSLPLAPPFRETGAFIPSALAARERAQVLALADAAIAAIGVSTGCLHTEIKLTPAGPRVIEVNGRIGGFVPALLPRATGVDILPDVMRLALGEHVELERMPQAHRVAYNLRMQAPVGMTRITEVSGLAELGAHAGVHQVSLDRAPGKAVDWRLGTPESVVTVIGAVADHDELRRLARHAQEIVRIHGV